MRDGREVLTGTKVYVVWLASATPLNDVVKTQSSAATQVVKNHQAQHLTWSRLIKLNTTQRRGQDSIKLNFSQRHRWSRQVVKTLAKSETPYQTLVLTIANDPPSGSVKFYQARSGRHPSLMRDLARPVDLLYGRMIGGGGPRHWQTGGLLEWKLREERRCARQ